MDDDTPEPTENPSSGNRWEPTGSEDGTPAASAEPTTAAPPTRPTWLTRTRVAVAGGAAAVLVAGGLGGFAVGRATGAHEDGGLQQRQGVPTGFDRDGDGGGPGLGLMPPGQAPGGQVPVMPGQDDGSNGSTDSNGSTGTDSSDT